MRILYAVIINAYRNWNSRDNTTYSNDTADDSDDNFLQACQNLTRRIVKYIA